VPAEVGEVDIVIFCVKLWDTEQAGRALAPLLGPQTLVLTFQNGVDTADILSLHIDRERIVPGCYYISAHIASPGVIEDFGAEARMVLDGLNNDPRLLAFKDACDQATGLTCQLTDGSVDHLWQKFIVLTAFSGATALLRKPLGAVVDHPETRAFLRDLVDEAAAVAFAGGKRLPPNVADTVFDKLSTWSKDAFASMAVDLMQGRPLELRWLSGKVHQLGIELNIPTPAHTAVYRGLVLYEFGQDQRAVS